MNEKAFSSPKSGWSSEKGPEHDIVLSSRVRLARNLDKYPMNAFPKEDSSDAVLEKVTKAVENINLSATEKLSIIRLDELPELKKRVLLEKHLISREHMEDKPNKAVILNEAETISIMVNEEDHLRIQSILPGLQLEETWKAADRIDDLLEEYLEYAFHEDKGYLTCCPTNVGTGLRASVMIHLPGLIATGQASRIFNTLGQLGLTIRGLYGEGTEAAGNLFQISNQITLGHKENDIIQNLTAVTRQIIEKEQEIRRMVLQQTPLQFEDKVKRAYGILKNAVILSSEEALNYLSDIRLGINMGILDLAITTEKLNEIMVSSQPGFLQYHAGEMMDSLERDAARAKLFNEIL